MCYRRNFQIFSKISAESILKWIAEKGTKKAAEVTFKKIIKGIS